MVVTHPVMNNERVVEITAQNHNYNVPDTIKDIAEVTHENLFDNTIEGVKYKNKPIFSVQHHPEASPGPHESKYVFKEFCRLGKIDKLKRQLKRLPFFYFDHIKWHQGKK